MNKIILILATIAITAMSFTASAVRPPKMVGSAVTQCEVLGEYAYAFKAAGWGEERAYLATFENGHENTFTITDNGDKSFDWVSDDEIGATLVKGASNLDVTIYDPLSVGEVDVLPPLNNGGKQPNASYIVFCWNPA